MNTVNTGRRSILHVAATLFVAAALVLGSAVGAHAADRDGRAAEGQPTVTAISVPMTLDCVNMSAEARIYAEKHNYCMTGVSPHNRVYGDCGSSWVFVLDNGFSQAFFQWGYYSTAGAAVGRSLTISYQRDAGGGASFGDFGTSFGAEYQGTSTRYTGAGWLNADMVGSILLFWGARCTLLRPTDRSYISPN